MTEEMSLVRMILVTAEICGTQLSEPAAEVMATELAAFDRQWIAGALKRCRHELKSRLTMAEVIARISDGRPGADEAFAMLPRGEAETVVWTQEMAEASVYRDSSNDPMTQRRAFAEAYNRLVAAAREQGRRAQWSASLGHDPAQRDAAVARAVNDGRLSLEYAHSVGAMLPTPSRAMLDLASKTLTHQPTDRNPTA